MTEEERRDAKIAKLEALKHDDQHKNEWEEVHIAMLEIGIINAHGCYRMATMSPALDDKVSSDESLALSSALECSDKELGLEDYQGDA